MDAKHQLETLLGQWRQRATAELGDEIDVAAAKALRTFKPPPVDRPDVSHLERPHQRHEALRKAFDAVWRKTAKRPTPVELSWLLSTVTARMPDHNAQGAFRHPEEIYNERLELLAAHAPDPRISRMLCELLAKAPFGGNESYARSVYEPTLELVAKCRDPRAAPALERIHTMPKAKTAGVRTYLAAELPAVIAKLPRGAAAKAKASSVSDELLGAILANLASDEARRVYGDHLHDQGDPRGELIALQLGPSSEAADKRCRALLKTNRAAWLGELDALVVNPQFRRGFLSGIELRPSWAGGAGGWQRLVASPLLATIEEIHQGKCNGKLYDALLAAPGLRALRVVDARLPSTLELLPTIAAPLEHVELPHACLDAEAGAALRRVRSLRSIGIQLDDELDVDWRDHVDLAHVPPNLVGLAIRGRCYSPDLELFEQTQALWKERKLRWLAAEASYTFGATRFTRRRTKGGDELDVIARSTDISATAELVEEVVPAVMRLKTFRRIRVVLAEKPALRVPKHVELVVQPTGAIAAALWLRM